MYWLQLELPLQLQPQLCANRNSTFCAAGRNSTCAGRNSTCAGRNSTCAAGCNSTCASRNSSNVPAAAATPGQATAQSET
jgi:hypothetical protein